MLRLTQDFWIGFMRTCINKKNNKITINTNSPLVEKGHWENQIAQYNIGLDSDWTLVLYVGG